MQNVCCHRIIYFLFHMLREFLPPYVWKDNTTALQRGMGVRRIRIFNADLFYAIVFPRAGCFPKQGFPLRISASKLVVNSLNPITFAMLQSTSVHPLTTCTEHIFRHAMGDGVDSADANFIGDKNNKWQQSSRTQTTLTWDSVTQTGYLMGKSDHM